MKDTFSESEKQTIMAAIARAEMRTSGEIRVHMERKCKEDVMDHAAFIFSELGMHKTAERNGVLIYLSWEDRKFAIIGDAGINARVGQGFWDAAKEAMLGLFKQGKIVDGIVAAIDMAGVQLAAFFPRQQSDTNELTDEISFSR